MENSETNIPVPELSPEEKAKLFNYPAIGELFSQHDTRRLDDFCSRLTSTRSNLERIVRSGSRDEAERAARAVRGIEVTLEFLRTLQETRLREKK